MRQEIVYINVHDIVPNKFQPRLKFDDNKLNELANSIKKYGILSPLILRKIGQKYEIIAGERRYKAALMNGMQTVPCVVMELTDRESAEIALIENIQREELNSIEEAKSYKNLIDNENQTKESISQSISKNIATIDSKLRFLQLTDKVKDALLHNLISEGHAKVLLKLKDKNNQDIMLDKIRKERLNVKDASIEVQKMNENIQNNEKRIIEQDTINLKELNQPDLELEKNNINNALNEINIDYENKKGEENMNEINNFMNNNMNNPGDMYTPNEQPQQNRFFTSLEDQQVNLNTQQPQNDELKLPTFNVPENNIEPQGVLTNNPVLEKNINVAVQPEMNNQNPYVVPPIIEQNPTVLIEPQPTKNIPDMNAFQNPIGIEQPQMSPQQINNVPIVEPQTNPFGTSSIENNNPFDNSQIGVNPFATSQNETNPFEQQSNNNPFVMEQTPSNDENQQLQSNLNLPPVENNTNVMPVGQPANNDIESGTPIVPVQVEQTQISAGNSYGTNFAPQVNQPNPAIDKIKALLNELKSNGFNIELSEADLMDSFQLTINIKK